MWEGESKEWKDECGGRDEGKEVGSGWGRDKLVIFLFLFFSESGCYIL